MFGHDGGGHLPPPDSTSLPLNDTEALGYNCDEVMRLDREGRQLLRDSLPLLDAGRQAEASELVTRGLERLQQAADLMMLDHQVIMAKLVAMEARNQAPEQAEPRAAPDRGLDCEQ